jgi:RNA polymerase sigma-70 factor (ECF subfamily)
MNRINSRFINSIYISIHYISSLVAFKQMSENEMTGNIFYFVKREAKTPAPPPAAPVQETARAEARIVERICAGDREAFGELYKLFAPMVHGIVLARVPRDEVDDITQNVFLSAYKNLHTLREPNAVGAWLAMIARNFSNEFYRRAKPTEELPEEIGHTDHRPQTEAREILAAIQTLPDAYKETLVLRLVEGMTGPEIAAQTGLTPDSVRVNLHRGMKLLRQKLGIKE